LWITPPELGSLSPISSLLLRGGKPAVLRTIWSIVVDAIDAQRSRYFSHVFAKVLENMPSLTYSNISASVVFPIFMLGIITASHHAVPDPIFSALSASLGFWIYCLSMYDVPREAPATQ